MRMKIGNFFSELDGHLRIQINSAGPSPARAFRSLVSRSCCDKGGMDYKWPIGAYRSFAFHKVEIQF